MQDLASKFSKIFRGRVISPDPHSGRGRSPPAPNTQWAQASRCWDPNLGPPQLFSHGWAPVWNYGIIGLRDYVIRKQISSPTQPYEKNIRHLFPILCLTIKLHSHSAIYFSILFVFLISSTSVWLYISSHCIVYCCLCVYQVLCYLVL